VTYSQPHTCARSPSPTEGTGRNALIQVQKLPPAPGALPQKRPEQQQGWSSNLDTSWLVIPHSSAAASGAPALLPRDENSHLKSDSIHTCQIKETQASACLFRVWQVSGDLFCNTGLHREHPWRVPPQCRGYQVSMCWIKFLFTLRKQTALGTCMGSTHQRKDPNYICDNKRCRSQQLHSCEFT